MKFLIAGRTGTGKDTLRKILEDKYGFTFVKSSTTRQKRYPKEDTHVFLTKEEAAAVPQQDKVAVTHIKNGDVEDEYFASRSDVEQCDAYIIDPDGIMMLLQNMPEEQFEIIYLYAPDKPLQKAKAMARENDQIKAEEIFEKRCASEDAEFSSFEALIQTTDDIAANCHNSIAWPNNYRKKDLEGLAFAMMQRKLFHNRTIKAIYDLANAGMYPFLSDGKVNYHGKAIRIEELEQAVFKYPNVCAEILTAWMMLPGVKIDQEKWNETTQK